MKQTGLRGKMLASGMALGVALLGACSGHVGTTPALSKDKLAEVTKQKLDAAVHQTSKSVTCDGDLEGKVGATQRCVLTTVDGGKIGVTDTVTKVEGTEIFFDAQADDKPME